jgi:hypothetical protein
MVEPDLNLIAEQMRRFVEEMRGDRFDRKELRETVLLMLRQGQDVKRRLDEIPGEVAVTVKLEVANAMMLINQRLDDIGLRLQRIEERLDGIGAQIILAGYMGARRRAQEKA